MWICGTFTQSHHQRGCQRGRKKLRDFVDDMVLFKETPNEEDTVEEIIEELNSTKARTRAIGQILNDAKEQIFVPFQSVAKLFRKIVPDYKGKIGQAVIDLGITHRTHKRASLNKGKKSLGYK